MRKPLLRQLSSLSSGTDPAHPGDQLSGDDSALRLPGGQRCVDGCRDAAQVSGNGSSGRGQSREAVQGS